MSEHIPRGRFLGHNLVLHGGVTMGEVSARRFTGEAQEAIVETLRDFPPTKVSIEEFERDMRAVRAASQHGARPHE